MKTKLFTYAVLSIAIVAGFGMESCSDDDDDKFPDNGSTNYPELIGTWSLMSSEGSDDGITWDTVIAVDSEEYEEFTFNADGTYTLSEWYEINDMGQVDLDRWVVEEKGRWTIDKGYLYLKDGSDTERIKVNMPSAGSLVLSDADNDGDWVKDTYVKGSRR